VIITLIPKSMTSFKETGMKFDLEQKSYSHLPELIRMENFVQKGNFY